MKVIYVDAENVGISIIEKQSYKITDKIFVFTKNITQQKDCEKHFYHCCSNYPTNSNQADFHIIAHLVRFILTIKSQPKQPISFELITNDKSLSEAFGNQCEMLGYHNVKFIKTNHAEKLDYTNISTTTKETNTPRATVEFKLYNALKTPHALSPDLRDELGLSQAEFAQAISLLSRTERIMRVPGHKKLWIRNQTLLAS